MGDYVAFFLDFENLYHSAKQSLNVKVQWPRVVQCVRQLGPLAIQRAYGNWAAYKEAQVPLLESGFELIHTPDYRADKGHDTRMIIDTILWGTRPHIGTVVLGTGDSDFIDVAYHLRNLGKQVVALAVQATTSPMLIQAVSRFIAYESLLSQSEIESPPEDTAPPVEMQPPSPPPPEESLEGQTQRYLQALARKIRMTPHPQRPEALLAFFPYLKEHGGTKSFKEIVHSFQEAMRREGRFTDALLQSLPHQVFHTYALLFEDGPGTLWDRVARLRPGLTSAKAFLDWCDMGLTLWIAKGLGNIEEVQPEPLAAVLYADTRPALIQRAKKVLELARQHWPHWPPRNNE